MLFNKRKKQAIKKVNTTSIDRQKATSDERLQLAELEIHIVRSKRKSISLHIKPEGIILRAPLFSPSVVLKAFALSKIDWLRKHQARLQTQHIIRNYEDGEAWLLFGQRITLRVTAAGFSKVEYQPAAQELIVYVGPRVKNTHSFVKEKVNTWYKNTAHEYLKSQVPLLAQEMQLIYKSINVRDYKARWGSCSSTGNLSFNWRIFMAPTDVIDSVIVHELAHIKHFNHSKNFWNLVYSKCPEYKIRHSWLKENQYLLQA